MKTKPKTILDVKPKKITVRELTDGYEDKNEKGVRGYGGLLDIRPPYQREFIYGAKERDEVIRTVAKEHPLNSMYWAVRDDGTFEIIDGQQRTISLCMFVKGKFSVTGLFGMKEPQIFDSLRDKRKKIWDYPLTVYECSGTDSQKLEWFETINIAGKELSKQELLNAVYSGKWVTDAKEWFSRSGCGASKYKPYLSGAMNRQEYLETAIRWASEGNIKEYMAQHQPKENAKPLWDYFESVFDWVEKVFTTRRDEMKGIAWGELHRKFKNRNLDAVALEKEVAALMKDDDVKAKAGIYWYVLTREDKYLNLRAFEQRQKTAAYEKQGGKCKKCKKPFSAEEMEGDHIIPWSKGGKTTDDNCQMLCKPCNRHKSDK